MSRFMEQGEKGKKGGIALPEEKQGFSYFTYGLLGKRIGKLLPIFGGLKQVLSLAGMKIGYKAYVTSMVFFASSPPPRLIADSKIPSPFPLSPIEVYSNIN